MISNLTCTDFFSEHVGWVDGWPPGMAEIREMFFLVKKTPRTWRLRSNDKSNRYIPSGELSDWNPPFSVGDTSSKGLFSITIVVYQVEGNPFYPEVCPVGLAFSSFVLCYYKSLFQPIYKKSALRTFGLSFDTGWFCIKKSGELRSWKTHKRLKWHLNYPHVLI